MTPSEPDAPVAAATDGGRARRPPRWVLAVAMTALLVLAAVITGPPATDEPLDPDSVAPEGLRGLRDLLEAVGVQTDVSLDLPVDMSTKLFVPVDRLGERRHEAIAAWVRDGGTLVVADPTSRLHGLGSSPPGFEGVLGATPRRPACALDAVEEVDEVVHAGWSGLTVPDGATGCFPIGDEAAWLVARPEGAGTIVALGSASALHEPRPRPGRQRGARGQPPRRSARGPGGLRPAPPARRGGRDPARSRRPPGLAGARRAAGRLAAGRALAEPAARASRPRTAPAGGPRRRARAIGGWAAAASPQPAGGGGPAAGPCPSGGGRPARCAGKRLGGGAGAARRREDRGGPRCRADRAGRRARRRRRRPRRGGPSSRDAAPCPGWSCHRWRAARGRRPVMAPLTPTGRPSPTYRSVDRPTYRAIDTCSRPRGLVHALPPERRTDGPTERITRDTA
jgi:hypothetical protein